MPNHGWQIDDENTKILRKMNHVVELERRKHLLLNALKGISMFAHQARQFTLTDREIDHFVVETLEIAVSDQPMGLERIRLLLDEAEEMRARSKKLYHWVCEIFSKSPRLLEGPGLKKAVADPRQVKDEESSDIMTREQLYWEGVCAQKLNNIAILAQFQLDSGTLSYDICGVIHETLDLLSKKQSIFNLIDLSVYLDRDPVALAEEHGSAAPPMSLSKKISSHDICPTMMAENY